MCRSTGTFHWCNHVTGESKLHYDESLVEDAHRLTPEFVRERANVVSRRRDTGAGAGVIHSTSRNQDSLTHTSSSSRSHSGHVSKEHAKLTAFKHARDVERECDREERRRLRDGELERAFD